MLIEHMDTSYRHGRKLVMHDRYRISTLRALIRMGILTYDRPAFPRETRITTKGRMALAETLASIADEIVNAPADEQKLPSRTEAA